MGVLELGGELDFAEKSVGAEVGEVDGGHAAGADFSFDAVAVAEGSGEGVQFGHELPERR